MNDSKKSLCSEAVFSQVFMEYSKTLLNFLFYKSGNQKLAEDLTQEAFLKLWQNCSKVSFEKAKGYVFATAQNLMMNNFKHQKIVLKFENKGHTERDIESPAYLLEEKELKEQIERAISELPEKQRAVFLLSRIDKKTYTEIGEMLGISNKAVEKRIYKALNTLRKVSSLIK